MNLALISPRLAVQKGDFLGSGVPYWPIELATLASKARAEGDVVSVLDLFGTDPGHLEDSGDHYLQGVAIQNHPGRHKLDEARAFIIYAISFMSHGEIVRIVRWLKSNFPGTTIAVLENSQAVTAYSLFRMSQQMFGAGADVLICGEPYFNWAAVRNFLEKPSQVEVPDNLIVSHLQRPPRRRFEKQYHYPVPAWDLFDLDGYWALPYSHGPKTSRFLPILTSRGCPYPCDFCVVPETNDRRWRGNAPLDVVNEIIELRDRFDVYDFQIEDLNPTVDHERWTEIARLLIDRNAGIRYYFVSGTKAETVHIDEIPLYAKSGCRYISISPESGSNALMKVIGKPFNYEHGLRLVAACCSVGIRTQACFLVGHPNETEADAEESNKYLTKMVRSGLDEVAVFIVAPFAGSSLYAKGKIAINKLGMLPSFSPKGRAGADTLEQRRQALIRIFFIEKLKRGPAIWLQGLRALFGTPQTKMENLLRRVIYISTRILIFKLNRRIS